jgi:hypothetical protein
MIADTDTRQCCSPFPCPYHGKNGKTCKECGCFQEGYWDWNDDDDEDEKEGKL